MVIRHLVCPQGHLLRLKKIAETIALLEGSRTVEEAHVLEALQYRRNEQLFRGEGCI